jgi:hypothetical protein
MMTHWRHYPKIDADEMMLRMSYIYSYLQQESSTIIAGTAFNVSSVTAVGGRPE